jgi:hypothetical protein
MKNFILILGLAIGAMACQKEDEVIDPTTTNNTNSNTNSNNTTTFNTAGQTLLLEGKFENGAHPTSGNVKIYEDKDKKRSLVFENFKTDAGPDLRIYLAEDKAVTGFVEITDMVKNGNLILSLPNNVDLKKQTHVLIWCKKFAVLFGSAQLK